MSDDDLTPVSLYPTSPEALAVGAALKQQAARLADQYGAELVTSTMLVLAMAALVRMHGTAVAAADLHRIADGVAAGRIGLDS